MNNFITIKSNIKEELVVKKSKFICSLINVNNKKEAESKIKEIKKKYYDARHNCIAYRIIEDDTIVEKSSDDGEPSGTAGAPMLNILQKNNLCNVLAIVTRYFGGILLGTGGLVKAYSDTLLLAIEKSEKTEKILGIEAQVTLDYNNLETFKYYCKKNNINIVELGYEEVVFGKIELEDCKFNKLLSDFETKDIKLLKLEILSKKIINKSIIN